jgi:hypothetical protein
MSGELVQLSARLLALLSLLLTLAGSGPARAAQLPPDVCEQLKTELASLTAAGVPKQLEQSPKAANRQLTVEQRSDITRYIKVEQQVLFRCPRPPAPPDPLGGLAVAVDPNEQGEVTDGTDIVLPRGMPVPKKVKAADGAAVKSNAKPAPKPATKTAAVDGAIATPKPKSVAAKPPAKPKQADAFMPAKPVESQ